MNVYGKLIYADGEVNEVNGVNDEKPGRGMIFFPIGNIEGVTAYGEWTARGKYSFLSDDIYDSLETDRGRFSTADGDLYKGSFLPDI